MKSQQAQTPCRSLMTTALFFAGMMSTYAVTVALPNPGATATSPDASIDPNISVSAGLLVTAAVDLDNAGTASSGAWSGFGQGGTSVELLSVLPGPPLAGLDLQTQTAMTPGAINFNAVTTTSGLVGNLLAALDLDAIVGAGLVQTWGASVNLSQLGLSFDPNTTYALSFDLTQSTSLLGQLSPAVFNDFTATVGDNSGTYGQGALPAGLLGITDIFGGQGRATLTFTTGGTIDGDVIANFGADAVADTDLLGGLIGAPNTTLYSIGGVDVTPIPEPGMAVLCGIFAGVVALRRRRAA
jgi:hypothetical protein